MAAAFDLASNPFYILNLSVRAKKEEIAGIFEEILADGRLDEATVNRSQQAILSPKSRIDAELSWFLNISPAKARSIVDAAVSKNWSKVDSALAELDGVDLANVAADLCCRNPGNIAYVAAGWIAFSVQTRKPPFNPLASLLTQPLRL